MAFKTKSFFFILLGIVALSGSFIIWNQKLVLFQSEKIVIIPGMSAKEILAQCYFIKYPKVFKWILAINGYQKHLKAGCYLVIPGMKASELFSNIKLGKEIQNKFKIIEGSTFKQILVSLSTVAAINYDLDNFTTTKQIMEYLGLAGIDPEGRFAPDTYYFLEKACASQILKVSYLKQKERLDKWWKYYHGEKIYKCTYEWLIIASCLEKESKYYDEQRLIAGVILRRLKLGMKLQLDPTVIYGLGKQYYGKLTKRMLQQKNGYNTYMKYGLPVTPICMPSESALKAALQPIDLEYLYYVAKPDGHHYFSKTYLEHQKAIKKYLIKGKK